MSRKKHDTKPVAAAAELAHSLLGEDDAKPVSETNPDWVEAVLGEQTPHWNAYSPSIASRVCERIAAGESLLKISKDTGMPSRATVYRWCASNQDFLREYQAAVMLRTDGLLEETIDIIDDKKEMVTETTSENEDGTKSVTKAFAKEGLAYAQARINALRHARKDAAAQVGQGGPRPGRARAGARAAAQRRRCQNMGNVVLDQHPLKEQIMAWQRIADQAKKKT